MPVCAPVRLAAVSPLITPACVKSIDAHYAWLRHVVGLGSTHKLKGGHTVVVLPEYMTLAAGLLGARATQARAQNSLEAALTELATGYGPAIMDLVSRLGVAHAGIVNLALTDTVWRYVVLPLQEIALEQGIYISFAGTFDEQVQETSDPALVSAYGQPGQKTAFIPMTGRLQNQSILIDPTGKIIGTWAKCFLTEGERKLGMTPGRITDIHPVNTPFGKVVGSVCLDAFIHKYLTHIRGEHVRLILQNSANDKLWAQWIINGDGIRAWQPIDWLNSVGRSVHGTVGSLQVFNACSMLRGHFLGMVFDGQPSVTASAPNAHGGTCPYIGVGGRQGRYNISFLASGPWHFPDRVPLRGRSLDAARTLRPLLIEDGKRLLTEPSLWKESVAVADIPALAA